MFESLTAFRAHCGEPTMPLETCPCCSVIPERCFRDYGGGDDDAPPQVDQLEPFMGDSPRGAGCVVRCPTCHRLYHHHHESEFLVGSTHEVSTWHRLGVDALYRSEWSVDQRLPDRDVERVEGRDFFTHHAIVRFRGVPNWFALDESNRLRDLSATPSALAYLLEQDPPRGLDDPSNALPYAWLVGQIQDPYVERFDDIRWTHPLSDEDRDRVAAARAAGSVDYPTTAKVGDTVVVRLCMCSKRRLIQRTMTIRANGQFTCDDVVVAENLPVKTGTSLEEVVATYGRKVQVSGSEVKDARRALMIFNLSSGARRLWGDLVPEAEHTTLVADLKARGIAVAESDFHCDFVWICNADGIEVYDDERKVLHAAGDRARLVDGRILMRADIARVIAFADEDYIRRGIKAVLRSGEELDLVVEISLSAMGDPSYTRNELLWETGWCSRLGVAIATWAGTGFEGRI